ncbi:MAG TPA: transporter substrate-binding domain-containing protein [Fulvivirga sp.]|nr:transporter substrate-binding domain-containing protein [Fulvivirga sp.]
MLTLNNKYLTLLITLLLLSSLSCRRSGNESEGPDASSKSYANPVDFDLAKIKKRGSLIAIVDNSSTGYFIYKGQPMGYEYDLLQLLSKYLKVRLEIKLTTSIDEAFEMLNSGKGDIVAYSLTVTKERKSRMAFTISHFTTRQMLVQRKPNGWQDMTKDQLDKQLIRSQVELIGKQINVRKSSSYIERLVNLSHEIGGDILIVEEPDSVETEGLIKKVAIGKIDYTVADETVAYVNASYFPNIDVNTPISFPQQIAWAVRKNAPELLRETNIWIKKVKKQPTFNVIFNRYFRSPRASVLRAKSDFASISGEKISIYDNQIKNAAKKIGWDWRLLASQMYQESLFDPRAKSWAGAKGLMQLIPETGRRFGAKNLYDPEQNILAGAAFLQYLDKLWGKTIKDKDERIKFVLASYNVGIGHVEDARNLAEKYGASPTKWDGNVEKYLKLKSQKEYFTDPIVESGYCRGDEPVNYVKEILARFNQYKQLMNS